MPYSDQYYYTESSNHRKTSRTPSHLISIPHLIRSLPYWIVPHGSRKKKPKTLIINAPLDKELNPREELILAHRLRTLEKAGFNIYFANPYSHFTPFSTIKVPYFNTLLNTPVRTEKELKELAAQKLQLANDQLLVIDQNELKSLMAGSEDDYAFLKSYQHVDLSHSMISVNTLNHLLKTKGPEIVRLDLNQCTNLVDGELDNDLPLHNVQELTIDPAYNSTSFSEALGREVTVFELTGLQLIKPVLQSCSNLKKLVLRLGGNSSIVPNITSTQIEEFELAGNHHNVLTSILAKGQHIKKLRLFGVMAYDFISFDAIPSESLEELVLEYTKVPAGQLKRLLQNPKKLKKLNLCGNSEFGEVDFYAIPWQQLEEINLTNVKITPDQLDYLLNHIPNIKKLRLPNCWNFNTVHLNTKSFPYLEELDVANTNINTQQLELFLHGSPQLKKLDLTNAIQVNTPFSKPLSDTVLESFSCSGVLDVVVGNILVSSPKLKDLQVNESNHVQASQAYRLNSLVKLELNCSRWNKALLAEVLQSAPHLKEIKLSGYGYSSSPHSFLPNLKELESVTIDKIPINGSDVFELLRHSTSLKSLKLIIPTHLTLTLLNALNLSSLRNLDLSRSCLSATKLLALEEILRNCSSLTRINFSGGSFLEPESDVITALMKLLDHPALAKVILPKSLPVQIGIQLLNHPNSHIIEWGSNIEPSNSYQQPMQNRLTLDADTKPNPDASYEVDNLFYAHPPHTVPSPSQYRFDVYDRININPSPCTIKNAFELHTDDIALENRPIKQENHDLLSSLKTVAAAQQYYGKQTLNLSPHWQPLASLSAKETMLAYHLSDPKASDAVEIKYSPRTNLYYIRKKPDAKFSPAKIKIDFLLQVPNTQQQSLPNDIQEKIEECRHFAAKELEMNLPNPSGVDYLNALEKQQAGACRHRTLVFKTWMDKHHPEYLTRIVENRCHSFIEFYINNTWHAVNLGGYPAKLIINDELNPQGKSQSAQFTSEGIVSTLPPVMPRYFKPAEIRLETPTPPVYVQQLISNEANKSLIEVKSAQQLQGLRYQIQKQCAHTSTPYFYVHSAEDLICSSAFVERQGNKGLIKKGPGGPLYDFLMQQKPGGQRPVLLVNFDNFSPNELVQFNALLDKIPKADGTLLPTHTRLIGLINPHNPEAYTGADFRSRFGVDGISNCPLSENAFTPIDLVAAARPNILTAEINLYGGQNWEEVLMGRWVMQGKELQYIEGELMAALTKKPTIEQLLLRNAPWDDEEFVRFWQEAKLSNKEIVFKGQRYPLPQGFVWPELVAQSGYSFDRPNPMIRINPSPIPPQGTRALNSATLSTFYGVYFTDKKTNTIHQQPGLLNREKLEGGMLQIYLTETLDLPTWALFLDRCKTNHCAIELTLAPGVSLPPELGIKTPVHQPPSYTTWPLSKLPHTLYVQSTDPDMTTLNVLLSDPKVFIIDASECSSSQLLNSIEGRFNEQELKFHFTEQQGLLTQALNEHQTVILKGPFQPELVQSLHDLLLQRQQGHASGQLIIMSEEEALFPEIPNVQHQVTPEEKKAVVLNPGLIEDHYYEQRGICEINAMMRHKTAYPNEPAENAWQGMYTIPERPAAQPMQLHNAEAIVKAFNQQRVNAVEQGLTESPFVFLSGLTGVAKTTFMHKVWKKEHPALYVGEEQLNQWAQHVPTEEDEFITLFLDEATITPRHWTELESLFHSPPWVRRDNEIIYLSPKHRVVLASNPLAYGGEREIPSFLKRHGNSILFKPMPPEYLYQELLKPIFAGTALDKEENYLPFLAVDAYLNGLDKNKLLLSPRELTMMALLTRSHCERHPDAIPAQVASYYAYTLAKGFVPERHKHEFTQKFKTAPLVRTLAAKLPAQFSLTQSNEEAFHALSDALHLRAARLQGRLPATGGLGGVVLEGEPGIGKTELVIKTLLAMGLKQGHIQIKHSKNPVFYVMPVSMSYEDKTKLLLKAFHEGSVVVVDELNSAPMMERLLNDLLMGKDPQGKSARKPGFMIIGTQNPATMAGRRLASSALQHRVQTLTLSTPSTADMQQIIVDKGLPLEVAQEIVAEFVNLNQESKQRKIPQMCFRDLVDRAEIAIKAIDAQAPRPVLHTTALSSGEGKVGSYARARFFPKEVESDELETPKPTQNPQQT